jgi:hypothetical protein
MVEAKFDVSGLRTEFDKYQECKLRPTPKNDEGKLRAPGNDSNVDQPTSGKLRGNGLEVGAEVLHWSLP